jgi:hypothetical protein
MSSSSSTYSYTAKPKISAADIQTRNKLKKEKVKEKRLLLEYLPFKAPPLENNQKSPAGYITLISSFPGVKMLDSIRVDKLPIGGLIGDSTVTIQNPVLSHTILGYDGLALAELKTNKNLKPKFAESIMKLANEYYKGNGTDYGLLLRMKKQLSKVKAPKITQPEIEYVCKVLPVPKSNETHQFTKAQADPNVFMHVTINGDAHPGAPFFASASSDEPDIMDTSIRLMTHYLTLLPRGYRVLENYFSEQEHIAESVTLLSAKQDCYERTSYNEKVRPFGVVPLALKMLFTYVIDNSVAHHQNFTENPLSQSAFRMTWSSGGADRIIEWTTQARSPGFYPLTWGDDQYILVVCKDGTKFLVTPDVMGMDMKIEGTSWGVIELYLWYTITGVIPDAMMLTDRNYILMYLKTHNISPLFYNLIKFFVRFAQDKKVLGMKGLVFLLSVGMLSGIPGTSYFDIVCSARINYRLSQVPVPADVTGIGKYLIKLYEMSDSIGFPFKREDNRILLHPFTDRSTVCVYDKTFTDHQDQPILPKIPFPLTFIGMSFYKFTVRADYSRDHKSFEVILPNTDAITTGMRCIYNVFPPNVPDREGRKAAAIFGRGFTTFTSQQGYTYLAELFNKMISMKIVPVIDEGEEDVYQPIPLGDVIGISEYPPREYFAKFFMSPTDAGRVVDIHIKKKPDIIKSDDNVVVVPPDNAEYIDITENDLDPNAEPILGDEDLNEESDGEVELPIITEEEDLPQSSVNHIPISAPSASSSNSTDQPITPYTISSKKLGALPTRVRVVLEDPIDESKSLIEPSMPSTVPKVASKPGLMPPDIKQRLKKKYEREERMRKWAAEEHSRELKKYRKLLRDDPNNQQLIDQFNDENEKYNASEELIDKYVDEYEGLQQQYDELQDDLNKQHLWEEDHEMTYDEYVNEKMTLLLTMEQEIADFYNGPGFMDFR